ncbi:hypothetical protein SteCoe_8552 [Stentor coeruleus]|uniref:Uncharacterized protein n=1 Tax=Stentor coeruleus TaxID=5963 RepID=A0A1R2CK18_9CILI|nr:hypothetical protein SteCoe_8552 [Stentor coeruleus]
MSSKRLVSLVYKNEVKFILSNALKVLAIQVLFNIATSNIFLQDFYGVNYFPTSQGDFIDVNQDILIIQPSSVQLNLQTAFINCSDARYIRSDLDSQIDILSIGYIVNEKGMRNTLIRFDNLTSLNNKKIVRAYVGLSGTPHSATLCLDPKEILVYRIDQKYGKITKWIEMPIYNPVPITSIIVEDTLGKIFYLDITLLVNDWINGTYANYGILLKPKDLVGIESRKDFHNSQKPPYLKVIYLTI